MSNFIDFSIPFITRSNGKSRLNTKVKLPGKEEQLIWYEVDSQYEEYLAKDRIDAFVVNFILYAMEHQLNLRSDSPISERLLYQLETYYVPVLARQIERYHNISLSLKTTNSNFNKIHGVGASLSGGVDSFYTLLKHIKREEPNFNITHLTFFNAGASGEYGGEKARERFHNRVSFIQDVADVLKLPLITVDTNINELLMENHEATHVVRTFAMVLALQGLFSIYYFGSGYPFQDFHFSYNGKDMAGYDLFSLPCLSLNTLAIYSSGGEATRFDKIKYISQFPITYKRLNVCVAEDTNCSKCEKCVRTMVALYAIGKLDDYKNVFDLDYFYKHKTKYFIKTVAWRNKKHDYKESYHELKKRHQIHLYHYILALIFRGKEYTKKVLHFFKRKIVKK